MSYVRFDSELTNRLVGTDSEHLQNIQSPFVLHLRKMRYTTHSFVLPRFTPDPVHRR